ncbi:MAG TPA: ABC-2 family transporter protein [Opitutaceae bacterium]|jgi:ABC-2 type transport system permease protein
MDSVARHLRVWLASARYSLVRATMFRGDLFVWAVVELLWITVNVVMILVIYSHTPTVAGWTEYQMLLLVGTSLLIQRILMGLFWSGIFEMGRNIRTGLFDFFLAQPGDPLFMASTRKLELDGLLNGFVAVGLIIYSAMKLGIHPGAADIVIYACMILCGVVIHYSALVMAMSLAFWITSSTGVEGSYFTLMEFSRLPREAFKGLVAFIFVWILPVVAVSNAPARTILRGFEPGWALGLCAATAAWLALAVIVFRAGLRRYTSASS